MIAHEPHRSGSRRRGVWPAWWRGSRRTGSTHPRPAAPTRSATCSTTRRDGGGVRPRRRARPCRHGRIAAAVGRRRPARRRLARAHPQGPGDAGDRVARPVGLDRRAPWSAASTCPARWPAWCASTSWSSTRWDLARATGQPFDDDPASLEVVHGFVAGLAEPGNERDALGHLRPDRRGPRRRVPARPHARPRRPRPRLATRLTPGRCIVVLVGVVVGGLGSPQGRARRANRADGPGPGRGGPRRRGPVHGGWRRVRRAAAPPGPRWGPGRRSPPLS